MAVPAEFNMTRDTFDIIGETFKDDDALITHQLASFNSTIDTTIPLLTQHGGPIEVTAGDDPANPIKRWTCRVTNCGISKPSQYQNGQGRLPLLPSEARNRNLTYAGSLFVDIEYTYSHRGSDSEDKPEHVYESKVCIGKIPIMVGSKYCHLHGRSKSERAALNECPYDRGGYFIINGSEKVIVSQERPVENTISCFEEPDPTKPYISRVEIKSTIDQRFFPIKVTNIKLTKYQDAGKDGVAGHKMMVFLPYYKRPVPLFVLFKAFGVVTDKDIFSYLLDMSDDSDSEFVNMIVPSAMDAHSVLTQADAIRYIANSINITISDTDKVAQPSEEGSDVDQFRMRYAKDLLNREFLPHVGDNPTKKLRFVALMVKRLLRAKMDPTLYSDRDKLTNKRLDLPGTLYAQIFRFYYQKMMGDIKKLFVKVAKKSADRTNEIGLSQELRKLIQKCNIQNKLNYALSTGNWYTHRSQANSASKKGVAQVLSRLAYQGTLSHLRRITSPLERAGSKCEPPRKYHGTQVPKICPNETPEGAQVGSVKNLSLMTHVSIEVSSEPVRYCLRKLGMIPIEEASHLDTHKRTVITVNGDYVGVAPNIQETKRIYHLLRHLKRIGTLSKYNSISWHQDRNHIKILTDGGRYSVPYYVIDRDNHFQIDHWIRAYDGEKLPAIAPTMGQDTCLTSRLEKPAEERYPFNHIFKSDAYKPWMEAAIEYLDTDEDETAMIAVDVEQLYDGQTFRLSDDEYVYYGHLTRQVEIPAENPETFEERWAKLEAVHRHEGTSNETIMKRREEQMARFKEEEGRATETLDQRMRAALDDRALTIYNDCVASVEVVPPDELGAGAGTRMIRLTLKKADSSLSQVERSFIVNINRFLSDNYIVYTHCMMHPATINGVVATNIPFSDHNQSPRNCYQSSMGKQAVGTYVTNYNTRMDTMANVLTYPQVPLVSTRTASFVRMDKLHHGYNALVAIACYTGYNQEDSLIGSLASAQRGCYMSAYSRTYMSKLQKPPGSDASESFEVPPERTIGRKIGAGGKDRYHAIVRNFNRKSRKPELPAIGAIVQGNDIIIPKSKKITSKKKGASEADTLYTDCSVTVRPSEAGVVDMVIPNDYINNTMYVPNNEDEDGCQFVKVRVVERRVPEIGDKFASRAAQKGTEGIQLSAADMMFNQFGASPDKIMNPQAVPSRMTEGQLLESLSAKDGCIRGEFRDATPFTDFDLMRMHESLARTGYDDAGEELMYNGDGELMEGSVTLWPTYYQRLKHMVGDKMHARELGPIQALTKQPAEGRARQGGLRLGEMERDCMIAHGAAQFLKEKMVDSSDIFEFYVSEQKQTVIAGNEKMGVYQCGTENIYGKDDICKVQMPWAMNLFRNELRTAMVDMRYIVE